MEQISDAMTGIALHRRTPSLEIDDPMEVDHEPISISRGVPGSHILDMSPRILEENSDQNLWLNAVAPLIDSRRDFSPMILDPPQYSIRMASTPTDTCWTAARLYANPLRRHCREHAHPGRSSDAWESILHDAGS